MMDIQHLVSTTRALVAPEKGILAADESTGTIKRRFDSISVESTYETRRDYREMLFRAPGVSDFISGVILFDETIRQADSQGKPLIEVLSEQGVIPGIKVDTGAKPLAGSDGELITEGLDGLGERLVGYRNIGALFSKWRAVITIGKVAPSRYCIDTNAHALARFAILSQEAGLVPIVEPEVLMDGDHDISRCERATESTLRQVFYELGHQGVVLEGMLLKPNMVLSGSSAPVRANPEEVARRTISCLKRTVPAAVQGIVFLSGGQDDSEATVNLDAINRHANNVTAPWQLSFSYGRGLQASPLRTWAGKAENVSRAQLTYLHRARVTSAARKGIYEPEMENA